MPTSRKNPNRKTKEFNPVVMEKRIQPVEEKKIFRRPTWNADDTFQISGLTLEFLANYVAPYRQIIKVVDELLTSGELEERINIDFFYEDGTVVPETDGRLKPLQEAEEKRLSYWRMILDERHKSLEELATKAENAVTEMNNDDNDKKTNNQEDDTDKQDKVIPMNVRKF